VVLDLRPRRWHRCGAADLAEACRRSVGARPGRDPADPAAERLRDRIVVQVDGQLKTGRDVIIGRCWVRRSSGSRPRRWWSAAAS
jgi:hypothetical protein